LKEVVITGSLINYSLLLDKKFIIFIKNTIREFENNNSGGHVSPHTLWETLKGV